MKSIRKFLAAFLAVTQVLTYALPAHAQEVPTAETLPTDAGVIPEAQALSDFAPDASPASAEAAAATKELIFQDGSTNSFGDVTIGANETWLIKILNAVGESCPDCRAIWQGNSFTNLGNLDIMGFLALIAPVIVNEGKITATGGLLLSNLGIDEAAFFSGMAELAKAGQNPANSYVLNKGEIEVLAGKIIALVGANGGAHNLGKLSANGGAIAIVSGDKVSFPLTRDGVVDVEVEALTGTQGQVFDAQGKLVDTDGLITNSGLIQANGGMVVLSAAAREKIYDKMINVTGTIEAQSLEEKDGEIYLSGGSTGKVSVTGALNASGQNSAGGKVDVRGDEIEVTDHARITAKGVGTDADGGIVVIFGNKSALLDDFALIDASAGETGNGGFVEFSALGDVFLKGGSMQASAGVNGGELGEILVDPANLTITLNDFTFGANKTFQADNKITVAAGVTISSRQVSGGDHLNGASTGNSGNLTFEAREIEIGSGAQILAQGGNGFSGGDVSLKATDTATTITPLFNYNDAVAKITINNATIKGNTVDILATAVAGRTFLDSDSAIDWGIGLLNVSGGPATLFGGGIAVAYSDAQVEVNSGSLIEGTNVKIKADAKSDATVTLIGTEGLMIGYGETETTAKVTVDGATIKATQDVNIESFANSKTEVNVTVAHLGTRSQAPLAVTFAGADSTTVSESVVKGTSNIEAGDDLTVKADTHKYQNVNASGGAYTDGVLGIALAMSDSESTTNASLGGTAKADGDIEVSAKMLADKNDVSAASAAGSGLVAGLVVGGLNGAINGVAGAKKPATTKDPNSQPFGLAASFAFSDHVNTVTSEIADNATVQGKGDIKVNAVSSERPETSAIASVDTANMTNDTKKNVAVSAAVVIGDFENNAEARIGTGATVDAHKDVVVHAEAVNPYSIQWDQINGVGDILDKINPNLGVQNGLFTSWAQASATGEDVGVAGSVNILTLENNAKAYIDENANINQTASYRTDQQDVSVTADTSVETLNISGNFGLNPVATGGAKGGIGVAYLEVDYINNVYAGIKSGAEVSGETVAVQSDAVNKTISIAESGGKGGQFGFNGAFSFQGVDDTVVAQIDDGAIIDTRADAGNGVLVHAKDEAKIINVAGGISKAGNVGIGTSVSLNEIDRDTRALIGNEVGDADSSTGSVSSDSNVTVEAENTGLIGTYSLAAAIVMPDAKVPSAGNFGIGISGDVSLNKIRDNTSAVIDDSDIKEATDVSATSKAGGKIESVSGAVTINTQSGTSIGLAGSYTNNDIVSNTKAYVDNSAVDATGDVKIEATNESKITSINAAGSGASAAGRAIASSMAYNDITNNTEAYVLDSDVKNSDTTTLKANDDSEIFAVAGSIAGGGKGGSGSGAVNNKIDSDIKAYSEDSDINSDGAITVDSSATGKIEGYAASIGIATSGTASSGSTSDNEVEMIVESGIKGKKSLGARSDTDITVKAVNDADIFLVAGNISASGQSGYGRSTGANDIDNTTRAYVDGARLDSKGTIDVKAESTGSMKVVTVGGTGTAGNSLAAGVSDNDITNITEAKIVSDSDVDATGDITMLASDTSTIQALGGVVAGGGNNSVGAVVSLNDVQNQILTTIDDSTVTSTDGKVSLDAYSKSSIDALAASGAVGGQAGLSGAVTLNEIDNEVKARITGGSDVDGSGKVKIEAYDESTIRSLAGAIAVGSNSLGGSVATNDIGNEVHAYIDGATVESTGDSVEVKATEKATIETVSVGGAFAASNAIGGSVSLNDIDNSTKAYVNTPSTVGATTSVVESNLDILIQAEDTSKIQAFAGQVGSSGSTAVAGAVATNDISNDTHAYAEGSDLTATTGYVAVKGTNDSIIETFAIAGGSAGSAALAGSVAINTIANDTRAYLSGSHTTADDTVVVAAKAKSTIQTLGGVLAGGGTAGIGGTIVLNTVDNITKAYVGKNGTRDSFVKAKGVDAGTISKADGTTGTDSVNGLAVVAESYDDVDTKSATLAVGGTGSLATTVTVNLVENDTQAYIENTAVNNDMTSDSDQSVNVRAYSGSDVDMKGGGLSAGGVAGIGATIDKTTVANTTKAFINGNTVKSENGVEVKSITDEKVNSIIASGGISGNAAVTGSVAVIDVDSTNEAYIENASVDAKGDIKVLADNDVDVDGYAGSLSIGGVAGAGASVVVTNVENDTTARITDSKTNATGVTEVNADSTTDVTAYTASGNLGGYAGVGGAVTVNTIATTTKAFINESTGTTEINESSTYGGAGQDVKVIAKDTTKLNAKDGSISGGVGVGFGASIDVGTVRNTTTASIGDNTKVSADRDVLVQASSNKDIDSVTVAAAGGAGMGVAGSVSIINVGSAITGEGSTAAASTSSFTNDAIGGANGSRAGNSDAANAANAKVNAQGSPSVTDEFSTTANAVHSTTASIGSSAVVDAGGDITVDADDVTEVDVIAGALAVGGFYGVGGAVALVNLMSRTNATVGSSADLSAGDDISVDAKGTVNESIIQTIAGTAGQISLGAAFAKIISDNDVLASIGNNAKIRKADQFQVLSENYSNIQAESYGASVGAGAIGISLAEGRETGTAAASLGSGVDVADEANGKTVNDVLVQAKASNYVQGYAVAAAGGIISGSGSSATAKANANTSATIGSGSDIDAENDITVKAHSRNYADADSLGVAIGGLTVGVALSYAETAPNVTAAVADSASGSGTTLNAKRDVSIIADSDENALAYSQSAAGGIISGNGSDADSRTAPNVKAFLGNNNEVDARDAIIKAYSITYSWAQASGISAGALAVAASLADAVTNATVQAYTGHSSKVRAKRNANVVSTFNILSDGTYLDDRTQAHSNASAGALVGITGTKSTVNSTANTGAWISTGSLLKGDNDSKIQTIANNATYANALGKAGGLLAGGYTGTSATLNTTAEAIVYGTGAVEAGNVASVSSQAVSDSYSKAEGGAGQDIVGALSALFTGDFSATDIPSIATIAGTSGTTTVNTLANTRTETGSSVKGGNESTVSSHAVSRVTADSYMSSTGVFVADAVAGTDVYVDSDAYTTVGGKVESKNVKILAQNNIDINAKAQADVHADIAAAFGTAVTRVRIGDSGDHSEAKVTLTSTSEIMGTEKVLLQALNFQQAGNIIVKAVAKAYGTFTATSSTLADGTAYVNSKIQQDDGSTITTGDLEGTVNTTYQMERLSEPTADTIVTKVIEVARTVVREICTWLPWPLDDLCETVTEVVFDLVTVIDGSTENSDIGGSGVLVGDNINMNGDIYNIGGNDRQVIINADGSITGGTGTLSGNDVILGDIQNDAKSKIRFNAEKGSITGTATIHLDKVLEKVEIINNSDFNLVVGKIDMISNNGGEPDVVYNAPTATRYTIESNSGPSGLFVDGNGMGDIRFTQAIRNNAADFTFTNEGGDIVASSDSVVFDGYHFSLRADNGNLGSSSQRLNFNLFKAKTLPDSTALNTDDASLSTFSYGDMFLSIDSIQTEFAQYNAATAAMSGFQIGDLTAFGNIDVKLKQGDLYSIYDDPACATCNDLKINAAPTNYNVKNVTAGKNVDFDIASGAKVTLDGTMQSGYEDISFDIDANGNTSGNLFNHEVLPRSGNKIVIKDIEQGGGHIGITGTIEGSGTMKALDGYSRLTINNDSGFDLEIDDLDLDSRINENITINGDTDVTSNEYGTIQVQNIGYGTSAITVNNTSGGNVLLTGEIKNASGATTIDTTSGSIQNTASGQLLKAKDLVLKATSGIGSGNPLNTAAESLDAVNTTSRNIDILEIASGGYLGINRIDQQGAGDVHVKTEDGSLTVTANQSGVKATSGKIVLEANDANASNDSDLNVNDTVTTTSGDIQLQAARDANFSAEGDVTTTSGDVEVDAGRDFVQADGAVLKTTSGIVNIDATRDVALGSVQSDSAAVDAVIIRAQQGEIRDNGDSDYDIIARSGTTTLIANTGIGSNNALDTRMLNVSGVTDSGNIQVDNTGGLTIVDANGVTGFSIIDSADLNSGESITVRTFSPLTVSAGAPVINNAGGDINLNALGNLAADDLTLNDNVTTSGGNGNILLTAGDTITIADGVIVGAEGSGNITAASGEDFTDGLLNQDGNTGIGGGDIIMGGTAKMQTASGNILADAADDFLVGILDADSDADDIRGDVTTFSRAGSTLDANGSDLNIIADDLVMTSGGTIGAPGDPIETKANTLTANSIGSMFFFNIGSVIANLISRDGSIELGATEDIILGGVHAASGQVILSAGRSILSRSSSPTHITASDVVRLSAGNVVGTGDRPINVQMNNPGTLFLSAGGKASNGLSANVRSNISPLSIEILGTPPGLALLNGIAVGGATLPLLISSNSGLYSAPLPLSFKAVGKLNFFYNADFPGIFNANDWSNPAQGTIDTAQMDQLPLGGFTLLPAETTLLQPSSTEDEKQKTIAEVQKQLGTQPPSTVSIPESADSQAAPSEQSTANI